MKKILNFVDTRPYKTVLICAALANALIWCLHARSLFGGLWSMICHPVSALYNTLLLLIFYGLALFFHRRVFVLSLVSIAWLGLGIADCVLLGMRVTPLQSIDFYIIRTGIAIVGVYMSPFEVLLSALGILLGIALPVLLFIKAPRAKRPPLLPLLCATICVLLAFLLFSLAFIGLADADPNRFDDPCEGYDVYGFPYCFLRSVFDRGIDRPEDYSEATVRDELTSLATREDVIPDATPNVIFIQLESFFDVARLEGVSFSEDPLPTFHALASEGISGTLRVPGIGSGTVNTEFEVLTGLPLDLFGTGEYPYESILKEKSCETIAYDLLSLGYGTHAFHNHTAAFYERYLVYSGLGFDDFTGAEYMKGLTYNALGWERDEILTSYIIKALDSTDSLDFVFAVTVQGHGGYPEIPVEGNDIRVLGLTDEAQINAYEYYAATLKETDNFIAALKDALVARGEETLLVLYGDHLPTLGLTENSFQKGDLLTTDYVIWSTGELPEDAEKTQDLAAYELFPEAFKLLQLEIGLVPRIRQEYTDDARYLEALSLLGYDTLYGDALAYGTPFPFARRNMRLGIDPIIVTEVTLADEEGFFVTGENFTESSQVFVNGRRTDTAFLSDTSLHVENERLDPGDEITVMQISTDLRRLSESPTYTVKEISTPLN